MPQSPIPAGIFPTDDWSVAQGEASGKPFIVRMRSSLPSAADRALFSRLIIISWEYEGNESGMPAREVHQQMQAFEDAIESGTERQQVAFQALSMTGQGKKEWRYYTSDTNEFMSSLNKDLKGHPAYPLEVQTFFDPDWSALQEYQSARQQ